MESYRLLLKSVNEVPGPGKRGKRYDPYSTGTPKRSRKSKNQATPPDDEQPAPAAQPQPQPQTQEHALLTLLGTDLDSYVAHHIEEYEAEKVKWTGCETEVWVKGADGKPRISCSCLASGKLIGGCCFFVRAFL